jgi:hypothetical protein
VTPLEELLTRAEASGRKAQDILSTFALFAMWMEQAPSRRERTIISGRLKEIAEQTMGELTKSQQWRRGPFWICSAPSSGSYFFLPSEMNRDTGEAWESAAIMRRKGVIYLPLREFQSALISLAKKIQNGEVGVGPKTNVNELLFNHIKTIFDEIVQSHIRKTQLPE